MEKDEIDTSYYNGIAVPERPIIIDNIPIYGVLYNQAEEELLKMKNMGDIVEYVSYLVATEQFIKNGGIVSDDGKIWFLPDGIHSFANNAALNRIITHLMKGIVKVKKYEFDDFIEVEEGELDNAEPRMIINKKLVDRYVNQVDTKQK